MRLARIILEIDLEDKTTRYLLQCFRDVKQWTYPTWRLVKLKDGTPSEDVYDVHHDQYGYHCSCPDSDWRHKDGTMCKHRLALIAAGILRSE